MSTKQELLTAAKALGITGVNKNTPNDDIEAKIHAVLGTPDLGVNDQADRDERTDSYVAQLAKHGEEAVAKETGAVVAASQNIPNLAPSGRWEGKRARIRRLKTGHNDMSGAIFKWNGFPCIIPIDVVVDIAWPILEIIKTCVGIELTVTQEEDARDKAKIHNKKNVTYYDKYPFTFLGVTPGTEHLPESPYEFVLDAYVDDFKGFDVRKWRQLCIQWEISDAQAQIKPGMAPDDEIEVRRNAIHYMLNIPQSDDLEYRKRVRDQKRGDIGMTAKAA